MLRTLNDPKENGRRPPFIQNSKKISHFSLLHFCFDFIDTFTFITSHGKKKELYKKKIRGTIEADRSGEIPPR